MTYFIRPANGEMVFSKFEAALVWIHLRLVIDPTAFDGNGAGFLFGQARFPDGEPFPIEGLQNVRLNLLSGGGAPPASWNMVYMGLDSFCLMDNIRATIGPIARLWALEVTQSIQDWFNRVPLIEGKETYVRAFLEATAPSDIGRVVEGKLRGFRDGVPLPGSPLSPMESPSIELPAEARLERPKFDGSFNFELPKQWTSNSVTLRLEVNERALEDSPLAARGKPRSGVVNVTFQPSARPRIALIPMGLFLPIGPVHPPPSTDQMAQVVEWIGRMYPVAELDVEWSQPVTFSYPVR